MLLSDDEFERYETPFNMQLKYKFQQVRKHGSGGTESLGLRSSVVDNMDVDEETY